MTCFFKKIAILLTVLTIWTIQISFAQEEFNQPTFHFEVVDLPGGPLGNHCQVMTQDSFGYMWFGTQGGLHRWDGYEFKTYRNDPSDSNSISFSYVEFMYVANDGSLWLGTWGGGLNHFDHITEKFTRYLHDPNNETSLSNNYVAGIMEDDEGNLWVGTQDGVNRLNLESKKIKRFKHDPEDPSSLSYPVCRKVYKDSEGEMWFGTGWAWEPHLGGGLNRYNPADENFTRYQHIPGDTTSLINSKVFDIFEDSKNNFWIATAGDGLHLMDRKTGKFQRLQNDPNNDSDLSTPLWENNTDYHTKFIFEDQNQKIWVGAWGGGIKYFDPETGYVKHFYQGGQQKNTIAENYAWRMFQSEDGTLWGCTAESNARVFKIYEQKKDFNFSDTGFGGEIIAYCETQNGDQWYSSIGLGLLRIDTTSSDTMQFLNDPKNPGFLFRRSNTFDHDIYVQSFSNDKELFTNIRGIVEDDSGWLWLSKEGYSGRTDTNLIKFNPHSGKVKYYVHDPNNEKSHGGGTIFDVFKDGDGRIWVTTDRNGELNLYNEETDDFTRFSYLNEHEVEKGISTHVGAIMNLRKNGHILIAHTSHNAMNKSAYLDEFDPVTKTFVTETIMLPPIFDDLHQFITGVEEDVNQNIWVSTIYMLHKIDHATGKVENFHVSEFEAPDIKGFVIDDQNRLWLSSSNGLVVYNPKNGYRFNYRKGIRIPDFPSNFMTIYKKSNGNIIVGSKSGVFHFDPNKIKEESVTQKPKVIFTDFQLMEDLVDEVLKNRISLQELNTGAVNLTYDQNVFSIRFAVLDFQDPENNQHEFMLENYDPDWRKAGAEPLATYVKVPQGKYTFRVRATSSKGVQSDEKTLKIFISPPWWQTWWAKIAFYTSLAFLIFGFYRFLLNRRLAEAEASRLKELDIVKTQLYTNITHEFRTPLTVITGMAKQIKENPKEWFTEGLNMITRNGDRLLNLVNQMLELSKLESGKMTLNLVQSDIVNYLKYLVESFHSYAESEKIQLHFLSDVKELEMDYDAEKLQQVVINLLSNAVKFTPEGGHIYISVRAEKDLENSLPKKVIIKVKDTGIGISEEQIIHVFDRFYQVDDSMTRRSEGSGIGLSLTHELVKLMDGEINVESEHGAGTEFTVILPVRNEEMAVDLMDIEKNPAIENILSKSNIASYKVDALQMKVKTAAQISTKPQILLIEDNPDVVAYVASFLEKDYQIKVGKDGQEGIEIALENIPDLIISDVMMPYKDGFEVCNTLKNDERTSHIPIIMLTAKADIQSKLEGLERGADAYLPKPFNKEELLLRIKKLLELREKLQQHYLSLVSSSKVSEVKEIPEVQKIEDYFVIKARKAVEAHLSDFDFNVEELCKEMMLSHSQVHRKLSALTGFSANKFIRYVRLNKAKELLQDQDISITAVAFDTGYNDPNYFGRVFKKEFGMTPQEWQKMEKV